MLKYSLQVKTALLCKSRKKGLMKQFLCWKLVRILPCILHVSKTLQAVSRMWHLRELNSQPLWSETQWVHSVNWDPPDFVNWDTEEMTSLLRLCHNYVFGSRVITCIQAKFFSFKFQIPVALFFRHQLRGTAKLLSLRVSYVNIIHFFNFWSISWF